MSAQPLSHPVLTQPWHLPSQGLALFEGDGEAPRLSHYFLPGLILEGKRILFLDGANCVNPHLMARLTRRRRIPFEQFNRSIQIARAFTCFQLTELVAQVPRFIAAFPASVLIISAFPDLYFDGDIRDWDARVAFEQALRDVSRWAHWNERPMAVALFTSSARFVPSSARKSFLTQVRAVTDELWQFAANAEGKLTLAAGLKPRLPLPFSEKFKLAAIATR